MRKETAASAGSSSEKPELLLSCLQAASFVSITGGKDLGLSAPCFYRTSCHHQPPHIMRAPSTVTR